MKKHRTNVLGCFLIFLLTIALNGCDLSRIIEDNIIEEIEEKQDELNQEDEENTNGEKQLVTAKIDGRDFSTNTFLFNETEVISVGFDNYPEQNMFALGFVAMDIRLGDKTVDAIYLYMHGPDFSSLTKGTVFKPLVALEDHFSVNDNHYVFDDYYAWGMVARSINEDSKYGGTTLGTGTIEVVITEIDHENKLISGKFEFTGYDDDGNGSMEVTDGEFKNIRWEE